MPSARRPASRRVSSRSSRHGTSRRRPQAAWFWYVYGELDEKPFESAATEALEAAGRDLDGARPVVKIVRGIGWNSLLDEIEDGDRSLVALGSHGQSRLHGIVLGSTATELVQSAVSGAHRSTRAAGVPERIVVGVDGSASLRRHMPSPKTWPGGSTRSSGRSRRAAATASTSDACARSSTSTRSCRTTRARAHRRVG